ncbi:MAG: hypothetical protein E7614_06970 [Ruminococcaceae bacterium]|nr:hypothetical protein [Oscillospiraceae bacterium]
MKKLSAILMVLLVIASIVTVNVSAEGDAINYASIGTYSTSPGHEIGYLSSSDSTKYYGDDDCTLLTDGVSPYYTTTTKDGKIIAGAENPGESAILVGTSAVHVFTFALDRTYDDIYEITLGNVWNSYDFGWENGENGKGNRGIAYKKVIITLSTDGETFKKTKDYDIVADNHTEDGSENGYYDYRYQFKEPVTAKYIQIAVYSPSYCFSLSEIEIWGRGNAIPDIVTPEESSEEIPDETSEDETEESVEESKEESKTEESKVEESKAEESEAEQSKAEQSKAEESKSDDNDGGNTGLIIVIAVVAVIAIAVVVVVVLKKKK